MWGSLWILLQLIEECLQQIELEAPQHGKETHGAVERRAEGLQSIDESEAELLKNGHGATPDPGSQRARLPHKRSI